MCRRLAVKDCHWVGLLLYFEFVFVCLCVGTFLLVKKFGVVHAAAQLLTVYLVD